MSSPTPTRPSSSRSSLIAIVVALVVGALVAIAGSQGGATIGGVPLFALAVAAAFAIQVIAFIPAMLLQTERFFDLTGSLTFFLISAALVLSTPMPDARSWILAAMVMLWAARLGSFLAVRVHKAGSDGRFDQIKGSPLRFLQVWVIQGAWVSLTAAAAWIAISADASSRAPIGWLTVVGIVVWALGMVIEIVADAQKSAFRADPRNRDEFIRTGLWSRSRHPNYFGEIVIWVGVFLTAAPVLVGWQWVALLSPLFVILLLTRVSGIPLLAARAEKKWGDRADYVAYREQTPVLIPKLTRPAMRETAG
jgi:steroid 5-alpha reductase family enzyme